MSSCGNPATDNDGLMPRRVRFSKGRDCIKCKANPGKIAVRHAVYCKECFTPLVTSKFRRSLEPFVNAHAGTSKRPRLKASGSLILAFSGGLGSSVLLNMVHKTYFANYSDESRGGINHPRTANVWASCVVCYVELCNAFPETRDRTEEITKVLTSYSKFDFIPLRLEYAFDESWWRTIITTDQDSPRLAIELGKDGLCTEALRHTPFSDVTPVDALRTYLRSLPTQTAVSSAIKVLVRLLLLYTAQSLRASHLLLGTSLTTLSISLISCISQGGGHSLLEELHEEWHHNTSTTKEDIDAIRVVRPLGDVTMKECAMFAWWNSIFVVGRDKRVRALAGIPGLTKEFIVSLEKDYPSTVSAIVRTCAKLEPKSASLGSCILCQRSIQAGLEDWKSRISIRSYTDAKLGSDLVHLLTATRSDSSSDLATSNRFPSISTHLCYSCRTTLTSRGSRATKFLNTSPGDQTPSCVPLPVWASTSCTKPDARDEQLLAPGNGELWVRKHQDEANQRNEIAAFLLET